MSNIMRHYYINIHIPQKVHTIIKGTFKGAITGAANHYYATVRRSTPQWFSLFIT